MVLLTFGTGGSYTQFITVLVIFVIVLGITAFVTRWMAGYQKQQGKCHNVEVVETVRIANNKYIQIVRVGEKYMAIAVCKDTVTMLGEIPEEQLKLPEAISVGRFRDILDRAAKAGAGKKPDGVLGEPKENQVHDEP